MIASLMRYLNENPDTADRVKAALSKVGYNAMHWPRVVPYQICSQRIEEMSPSQLDVLEIATVHDSFTMIAVWEPGLAVVRWRGSESGQRLGV